MDQVEGAKSVGKLQRITCSNCKKNYAPSSFLRHWCEGFNCSICGKKYVLKQSRDEHLRTHDPNFEPFKCECGKTYARKRRLNAHKRSCAFLMNLSPNDDSAPEAVVHFEITFENVEILPNDDSATEVVAFEEQ